MSERTLFPSMGQDVGVPKHTFHREMEMTNLSVDSVALFQEVHQMLLRIDLALTHHSPPHFLSAQAPIPIGPDQGM